MVVVYLSNGRFNLPKNAPPFKIVAAGDVTGRDETAISLRGVVAGIDEMAPKVTDAAPGQVIALETIPSGDTSSQILPAGSYSLTSLSEIR